MDEYIRREDVLKGKKTGTFANGICLVAEPCVTVKYIESIEPADVVQVVRCRECKHLDVRTAGWGICKDANGCGRLCGPNDFCSSGIRKK